MLLCIAVPGVAMAQSPEVEWGTYYGGPIQDDVEAVEAIAENGVWLAGGTNSSTGIATPGAHQTMFAEGFGGDAYLARFDASGQRIWSTYFGGFQIDGARAIADDSSHGAVVLVGLTDSDSQIATPGAHQTSCTGEVALMSVAKPPSVVGPWSVPVCNRNGFIAKFDLDGNLLWATYFGGPGVDFVDDVALDGAGNLYVCGYTTSTSGIAVPDAHQTVLSGTTDSFLAKFDPDGVLLWSTYYVGTAVGCSVARDDARDAVYIAGALAEFDDVATPGAHQEVPGGNIDIFLARFTSDGERVWGTYYGGEFFDAIEGVRVDHEGSVYLGGQTSSATMIATPGAHQDTIAGLYDLLLAKFTPDGELVWGTYFGGEDSEDFPTLAVSSRVDRTDGIYLGGNTISTGLGTPDAPNPEPLGGEDLILAKFTTEGTLEWATYYGGSADEILAKVDAAADGLVYLGGRSFYEPEGLSTPGSHQPEPAGFIEGFLVQFSEVAEAALEEDDPEGCDCASTPSHLPGVTLLVFGMIVLRPRSRSRR